MKIKAILKIIFAKEYLIATDKSALINGTETSIKQVQLLIKYLGNTKYGIKYQLTNKARQSEVSGEN